MCFSKNTISYASAKIVHSKIIKKICNLFQRSREPVGDPTFEDPAITQSFVLPSIELHDMDVSLAFNEDFNTQQFSSGNGANHSGTEAALTSESLTPSTIAEPQEERGAFEVFPGLPLELRDMIWTEACKSSRLVCVDPTLIFNKKNPAFVNPHNATNMVKNILLTPPPAIMAVNKESRKLGKIMYEKFSIMKDTAEIYLNPTFDTLCLRLGPLSAYDGSSAEFKMDKIKESLLKEVSLGDQIPRLAIEFEKRFTSNFSSLFSGLTLRSENLTEVSYYVPRNADFKDTCGHNIPRLDPEDIPGMCDGCKNYKHHVIYCQFYQGRTVKTWRWAAQNSPTPASFMYPRGWSHFSRAEWKPASMVMSWFPQIDERGYYLAGGA